MSRSNKRIECADLEILLCLEMTIGILSIYGIMKSTSGLDLTADTAQMFQRSYVTKAVWVELEFKSYGLSGASSWAAEVLYGVGSFRPKDQILVSRSN